VDCGRCNSDTLIMVMLIWVVCHSNWREIKFQEVTCSGATNPDPHVHNWGCLQDCHNNEKADVCQGVQF